jgi:hypothetical protein
VGRADYVPILDEMRLKIDDLLLSFYDENEEYQQNKRRKK